MYILLKKISLTIVLLTLSPFIYSAQLPSAGSQIQQIPAPPEQIKEQPKIQLELDSVTPVPSQDTAKIYVNSLRLTGNQVYSEIELIAVTGFSSAGERTLADLQAMALNVTDYYHSRGYFLAQAYLPAQDINAGVVTIEVLEGRFGEITLRNTSNFSDALADDLLSELKADDVITIESLESSLLLLSDMPGVNVRSTLMPGASVGSSDLIVDVTPGSRFSGSVYVDNQGSRYTGSNRLGATLYANELVGRDDVTTLQLLTSAKGLNYARISYQQQFGRAHAGLAFASMDYKLGKDFESLQARGTAEISSLYGSYTLIRRRNNNLSVLLNYDDKSFVDKIDSTTTVTKKAADVFMLSINGNHRYDFGGGGLSQYSFTWTAGEIDILSPAALAADALSADNDGHYNKFSVAYTHQQNLTDRSALYLSISGQLASKNLDTSEKIGLGGVNAVRAYPEGEAYGDEGYVLTLETRTMMPALSASIPGQVELIGFIDHGAVTLNDSPWESGNNHRALSSAGIGFQWVANNKFIVEAYLAHKLGNAVAESAPDKMNRFWIQGVMYF